MTHLGKLISAVLLALALFTCFSLAAAYTASASPIPFLTSDLASVQQANGSVVYLNWGEERSFVQVTQICTGEDTEAQFYAEQGLSVIHPGTCQNYLNKDGIVDISPS